MLDIIEGRAVPAGRHSRSIAQNKTQENIGVPAYVESYLHIMCRTIRKGIHWYFVALPEHDGAFFSATLCLDPINARNTKTHPLVISCDTVPHMELTSIFPDYSVGHYTSIARATVSSRRNATAVCMPLPGHADVRLFEKIRSRNVSLPRRIRFHPPPSRPVPSHSPLQSDVLHRGQPRHAPQCHERGHAQCAPGRDAVCRGLRPG